MSENRIQYAKFMQQILCNGVALNQIKDTLQETDKGFFNMLMMTTLRQLTFIKEEVLPQFIKKKIPQKQKIFEYILYLGVTELLFMNTPDYAVINSYVEATKQCSDKYGANFVNAVLRNILRQKNNLLSSRKSKYFSKDFLKILKQDYSSAEIEVMEFYASLEPPLDVSLKKTYQKSLLNAERLPTGSFRFNANTKVYDIEGFNDGNVWVQDAAAAIAVNCLGNIQGKKVLDLCAAPGGKTAQLLDAGAHVVAIDISQQRLNILKENIKRLNLADNLKIIEADVMQFATNERFDIILADVPCSATGTFRRHPEIMHTKTIDDVKKQSLLQQKILSHAMQFLAPQGKILYVTCSLAKAEGERQILQFISNHPQFEIIPLDAEGIEQAQTKEGFLRILPQHFAKYLGADGFFIACLQRKI